jgi:hypothetical protein
MKIPQINIIYSIFAVLVFTTAGCDSEQVSDAANPVATTTSEDQQVVVPLPRNTKPKAVVSQEETKQDRQPGDPLPTISSASQEDDGYQEIQWDELVPAEYRPEVILGKYMEQLAELDDSDPKAMQLYGQIQAELDNAPINEALNGKKVKLAGFIAPLENTDGKVSDFLLVPYFGACIHVPPPPVNQTVLVQTAKNSAIESENSSSPFWIKGILVTESESTDIGAAGYRIDEAITEIYE